MKINKDRWEKRKNNLYFSTRSKTSINLLKNNKGTHKIELVEIMEFELSEEHKMVQKSIREYVAKEVVPNAREWDLNHELPYDKIKKDFANLGVLGICFPEKYGGAGMDYISLAIACAELEYGESSLRVIMSVHTGLNSCGLYQWGTEEQKKKYLVPQAKGEKFATYGLTEPFAGSDVSGIRSAAVKKGDTWVVNGQKMWISLATVADNFLIFAYTDRSKGASRGMSCFIIEKDFPGVTTSDIENKLGVRSGSTGEIVLKNVEVPAVNMLGEEGEGFKIAMSCLDNGRYTVAAGAVGLTKAALDVSVKYAHERETFGQEIGRHQLIQQKIAKMVSDYESSRLLVYRAGVLKNKGIRNTKETALAKWVATNAALDAANEAIQVHGSYGFSADYPVERMWRNARGAVIYEGTNEIQTIIQGEYALGYRKDKPLRKKMPSYTPSD
ncbi:MAG: Acyl-CoA dehydrogenase [Candidatus Heimdallarchaeota archaeon LC_3]|nr:MAG: Acyl-CoA dehydrogenase [Candidatus Heimdallarchaeota archaeon LC_3]